MQNATVGFVDVKRRVLAPFKSFATCEDGAVTVDFMMVAAVIAGLGLTVMTSVRGGAADTGQALDQSFKAETITLAAAVDDEFDDEFDDGGDEEIDLGGDPFLDDDPADQPPADDPVDEPTGDDNEDDGAIEDPADDTPDETVVEEEPISDGCFINGSGRKVCNGKK